MKKFKDLRSYEDCHDAISELELDPNSYTSPDRFRRGVASTMTAAAEKRYYKLRDRASELDDMSQLHIVAKVLGRRWKSELSAMWASGDYGVLEGMNDRGDCDLVGTLQEIRNSRGPSWLARVSLKDVDE